MKRPEIAVIRGRLNDGVFRHPPCKPLAYDFFPFRFFPFRGVTPDMTLKRMDNVLIVVDDLEAAKAFFIELGLKLEGETTVEGPLVGSLIGLKDVRATLAMMRTPDGQCIELDKFHTPNA